MWGNRFEEKPSGRPKVFLIRLGTKFGITLNIL